MTKEERIYCFDSMPGSGKTSYILEYINTLPEDKKVIYITPFLDEVERVKQVCSKKKFIAPDRKKGRGRKRNHLLKLIQDQENIVSTHSLFSNIDEELIDALSSSNYILILDEVMDVLDKFNLWEEIPNLDEEERDRKTSNEIRFLEETNIISVDKDTGQIYWLNEKYQPGKYETFRNLALRELLFFINNEVIVWTFPIDVFMEGVFTEIYILTYQFDWQIQASYYKYYGLEYTKYHIETVDGKYVPVKTESYDHEIEWRDKIKNLINIVDNQKMNMIGDITKLKIGKSILPLTKTWYDTHPESIKSVVRNMENFFKHITRFTKSSDRMWTSFVKYKNKMVSGAVSRKNWLPINSRATNNYSNKKALVYTIDRYLHPFIVTFFSKKDVVLDQDKFALSELIQWIWRSAIRNGEEIDLYIPSTRMRTLLIKYLNNEEIKFKANAQYYYD